jgi:hypothetical protein
MACFGFGKIWNARFCAQKARNSAIVFSRKRRTTEMNDNPATVPEAKPKVDNALKAKENQMRTSEAVKSWKDEGINQKSLTGAAALALAGLLLATHDGLAQFYVGNDVVLGFNRLDNGGAGPQPPDYVLNLGNAFSSVGVGGSTVVNLSSYLNLTTFNSTFAGGLASGVSMSAVGGNPVGGSSLGLFATLPRLSLGSPNVAGSTTPHPLSSSALTSAASDIASMMNGLGLGAGGSATVLQTSPNSFNSWVLSTSPPSYQSATGIDPRAFGSGPLLYEDLYHADSSGAFSYTGFLTLDTGSASLTFTPSVIPEPSPFGLICVGLVVSWLLNRSPFRKRGRTP